VLEAWRGNHEGGSGSLERWRNRHEDKPLCLMVGAGVMRREARVLRFDTGDLSIGALVMRVGALLSGVLFRARSR